MSSLPQRPEMVQARLRRDFNDSLISENIARELAPAAYRQPWHACETWQQETLRTNAQALVRSFNAAAAAVALHDARRTFFQIARVEPTTRAWDVVSEAFERALAVYWLRLSTGTRVPMEPTPEQDAAYTRGTADPHADDYVRLHPIDPRD